MDLPEIDSYVAEISLAVIHRQRYFFCLKLDEDPQHLRPAGSQGLAIRCDKICSKMSKKIGHFYCKRLQLMVLLWCGKELRVVIQSSS